MIWLGILLHRMDSPYPRSNEIDATVSVTLRKVSMVYGRRAVFRDLCSSVESGSVLAIAGPNGSGKSTLIKIIAGLLQPETGDVEIRFQERLLDPLHRRPLIGMVAPDLGLYGSLTGIEHVQLFAKLRGLRYGIETAGELLARVGLKARRGDPVRAYSSGMRQRLRLACAVLHAPRILLLDEPYMALDTSGVEVVQSLIDEQRRRGITLIAGNDERELALADERLSLVGSSG